MIVFHPKAQQELVEAAAYYEEQLTNLGDEFLSVVEQAVDSLEDNPKSAYLSHPQLDMRRYVIPRFPFLIYYREGEEWIEIFAIAHQSKRPDYWLERSEIHRSQK